MITVTSDFKSAQAASVRQIKGKIVLTHNGTSHTYTSEDIVKSINVQRVSDDKKMFGAVISHRATVELLIDDNLSIDVGDKIIVYLGFGNEYVNYAPMYISDMTVNETDNIIQINAYDGLVNNYKFSDIDIEAPYTLTQLFTALADLIGCRGVSIVNVQNNVFSTSYPEGGNYDDSNTFQDVISDLAGATQTFIYINSTNLLVAKRLSKTATPYQIDTDDYYDLSAGQEMVLANIASVTELGDNIITTSGIEGVTQNEYENGFYNALDGDDLADMLDEAISYVGGTTIAQFEMNWFGALELEIGDRLKIVSPDGTYITTYLLDDSIEYDGSLREKSLWSFNSEAATANPTSLGEALKMTYAKVDKVNQEITLHVQDIEDNVTEIQQTSNQISLVVQGKAHFYESSTEPSSPNKGDVWHNTSTNKYYRYGWRADLQENGWIEIDADEAGNLKVVNGIYQTLDGVVFQDTTTGETVIDGSHITTGTINASRIDLTGAVSYGDCDSDLKGRIDSGGYGDNDVRELMSEEYAITHTALDGTMIQSPKIYGGELYAGVGSGQGVVLISANGINFSANHRANVVGMGYDSTYTLPLITLGSGVDGEGSDKGMIRKFSTGIFIGDSDSATDNTPGGDGVFINFTNHKIYAYRNGTAEEIGSSTAVFG